MSLLPWMAGSWAGFQLLVHHEQRIDVAHDSEGKAAKFNEQGCMPSESASRKENGGNAESIGFKIFNGSQNSVIFGEVVSIKKC